MFRFEEVKFFHLNNSCFMQEHRRASFVFSFFFQYEYAYALCLCHIMSFPFLVLLGLILDLLLDLSLDLILDLRLSDMALAKSRSFEPAHFWSSILVFELFTILLHEAALTLDELVSHAMILRCDLLVM